MIESRGLVIFRENDGREYLLMKYGYGHWGFVKGKIEEGEKDMETAMRETREEAGIEENKLEFFNNFREKINYSFTRRGKTIYKEVVFFLAKTTINEIRLSPEHLDYRWLGYEKALELLTYENAKNVLKKAEEFLKTN